MTPPGEENRKRPAPRKWVVEPPLVRGRRQSAAEYEEQCRRQAIAQRSKREFGRLPMDVLVFVALEHRLVTMRLGAVKALEKGNSRKHLSALLTIESTPSAGGPVRAAAHQSAEVVRARLDAR